MRRISSYTGEGGLWANWLSYLQPIDAWTGELLGPEHTGHFVQPHVAAHCGGPEHTRATCGGDMYVMYANALSVAGTNHSCRGHMWLNKVASVLGSLKRWVNLGIGNQTISYFTLFAQFSLVCIWDWHSTLKETVFIRTLQTLFASF